MSNFSPYEPAEYMIADGIKYQSSEHYYQAMKFENKGLQLMVANHPFKGLKKYARTLAPIREDWDVIKVNVMRVALEHKFGLPRYQKLLLSTGDLELVERNTWGDVYWGVANGRGENNLGKMLMEIRSSLNK